MGCIVFQERSHLGQHLVVKALFASTDWNELGCKTNAEKLLSHVDGKLFLFFPAAPRTQSSMDVRMCIMQFLSAGKGRDHFLFLSNLLACCRSPRSMKNLVGKWVQDNVFSCLPVCLRLSSRNTLWSRGLSTGKPLESDCRIYRQDEEVKSRAAHADELKNHSSQHRYQLWNWVGL